MVSNIYLTIVANEIIISVILQSALMSERGFNCIFIGTYSRKKYLKIKLKLSLNFGKYFERYFEKIIWENFMIII